MRASIVFVLATTLSAIGSTALGQTSELFINQSDSTEMVVVQGGSVIRSWNTVNAGENALAVSDTIRTAQSLKDGYEYDLSGTPLGPSYQIPVFFGRYYDGTTDGVNHNYAMVYNDIGVQGQVFRFDRSWQNADPLSVLGTAARAVTFDPVTETLWYTSVAFPSGLLWLRNVDLAGNPLDSFTVPGSGAYAASVTGLAFDPVDGTLWFGQLDSSLIRQVDPAGTLLTSFEVPGISTAFGMEFAVPEPSSASFQGLGFLPGAYQDLAVGLHALSRDGTTAVGSQFRDTEEGITAVPFRWTQASGLQELGYPAGHDFAYAFATSADGSVVVGTASGSPSGDQAFRWTVTGGHELIGGAHTDAYGVSGDGLTVVGHGEGDDVVYRVGEGWSPLPVLPGYDSVSTFFSAGVSSDGSVIAASVRNAPTAVSEAARWTPSGVQGLGLLPGYESTQTGLAGLSPDGSTVVGYAFTGGSGEAFRWTESGGMVSLGDLPGGDTLSIGSAVSGDGSVVVGRATDDLGEAAFIWDEINGMRSLQDVLVNDYGLNLDGWRLTRARGISDDGLTIAGIGINPLGQEESWIATILQAHPGDFDGDGDVDLVDFASFQLCFTGPGGSVMPGPCERSDFDGDGDCDLTDFGQFQLTFGS